LGCIGLGRRIILIFIVKGKGVKIWIRFSGSGQGTSNFRVP